jgi:hypothetical protein
MGSSSFVRRHAATLVIGGAALVAAGAGGAVAQQVIDGSAIAPGTVGARQIATGAIGPRQLHSRAVGAEDLASGAVNRSKLGQSAVGPDQIAKAAVTPAKLASGAVNTGAMAPKAVTRAKLAADARVPQVVTRFVSHDVQMNTQDTLLARCATGEVLIGGGFGGVPTTVTAAGTQATVLANRPEPDVQGSTPQAWMVIVDNHSTSLAPTSVYAICAVR